MKQLERKSSNLTPVNGSASRSLTELKAIRLAQKATNQRVEELKLKLFRLTEQHMDQVVSLVRDWLGENKK